MISKYFFNQALKKKIFRDFVATFIADALTAEVEAKEDQARAMELDRLSLDPAVSKRLLYSPCRRQRPHHQHPLAQGMQLCQL